MTPSGGSSAAEERPAGDAPRFLDGPGVAAKMIRERDWSSHPLGPPASWPPELRAALSLILNSPESMILAWGPELHFFFNDTYIPLLGPRLPWAMGAPFREVWADGWEQAEPIIRAAFAGEPRRFVDLPWRLATDRGPQDTWWTFSYSRVLDGDGAVAGLFILTSETTAGVLGEARRKAEETRNRQVLDSAIDYAIIATDLEGRITRWNEGAQRVLGWTEDEMLGQGAERIFTPEDRKSGRVAHEMRRALEDGRGRDERWHLRKSGERFWANGRMTPLRDSAGEAVGFVKVLRDQTAEHQAAEALRNSESRLQRAQQAGGVGVFSVELADDLLYGSPEFCRIFGVDHCDGVPTAVLQAQVLPEDADVTSTAERRDRGDVTPRVEYRIRHGRTGEERVIARSGEMERNAAGEPVRLVGVVQDVTERRAAQRVIEASEARFRAFAQAVPNHVWTATPDGRVDWANDRAHAYSGQDGTTLREEGWQARIHPDDVERTGLAWRHALGSGEDYETEFRLQRRDGAYRWHLARATPLRDKAGAVTGWLGSNTDIDDQKAAAETLRTLNDELERRVEARTRERDRVWRTSRDLIIVVDMAGLFQEVSPAATHILGWEPAEMVGRSVFDFLHLDDVVTGEGALGRATREPIPAVELRYRHRDGGWRWLSWTAAPEAGLITATGRDVTEVKAQADELALAQEALRQAQKMEAVGQLTGGIAHDFNNLLTGITGSLELLASRIAQGRYDAVGRYLGAAQGAAQRAASLTQRLLAFSRRQTLDPRPTDVNRLVAGMEDLIRRSVGPNVQVEVVGAGGLWPTLVDPPQLENALLNLCVNARDAMPEGGRITIETANKWLDERAALERELPAGQYVSLCVTDTGTGMTPEVIGRAFDPFFTTKPIGAGTGLGLSMIYGFVRQSGGQVRIYSELGLGTTFCLYLPRHHGAAPQVDTAPHAVVRASTDRSETVLVVDDEPTVRMLVAEVLAEAGFTALEAADGAAGLNILESGARVDLLVTDVGLPGGLNGRQVADAGRVLRPGLKVLFITGYAENAAVGNGHLEPGMQVLTKPFAMTALADRIREMIEA